MNRYLICGRLSRAVRRGCPQSVGAGHAHAAILGALRLNSDRPERERGRQFAPYADGVMAMRIMRRILSTDLKIVLTVFVVLTGSNPRISDLVVLELAAECGAVRS